MNDKSVVLRDRRLIGVQHLDGDRGLDTARFAQPFKPNVIGKRIRSNEARSGRVGKNAVTGKIEATRCGVIGRVNHLENSALGAIGEDESGHIVIGQRRVFGFGNQLRPFVDGVTVRCRADRKRTLNIQGHLR